MKQSRREFIKKTGCALSMISLATQIEHFGMMTAMAQKVDKTSEFAPPADYRALVCIFLQGGNDGNNTVIPNHSDTSVSNYGAYSAARNTQGLAIPQASLLPMAVPRIGGLTYGLNPNMGNLAGQPGGIHDLYALGKLAIVTNVGTLVKPMTRTQYQNGSVQKPYQLFSHSDQVAQAQTARSDGQAFTGWAGRISDRTSLASNPSGLVPMITSIAGAQLFTNGQTTLPLAINNAGTPLSSVLTLNGYGTSAAEVARRTAFDQIRALASNSNVVNAAKGITNAAMQASQALSTFQEVTVAFPTTNIGNQLKQVARMIKKRTELGVQRQIFYVQVGSFDTHTGQINGQGNLLAQFSQASRAFYDEMVVQGVDNNVTAFTLSDFSRTFNPAGSGSGVVGSDHAWANHAFVFGGAVLGGNFYGDNTSNGTPFPTLTQNGPDDADNGTNARGRWIPTTSVDQYANTLARWYGLTDPLDIANVFPNLSNFTNKNLGFLP